MLDDGVVINGYGPTESTTFACCYRMAKGYEIDGSIPIGQPISHTSAYVLDDRFQLLPAGVPGELFLGGAGLALGYLNQPELTDERFIPNPFSSDRVPDCTEQATGCGYVRTETWNSSVGSTSR